MKIQNGTYFLFFNGKHLLTKKIKDGKGENYFPFNEEIPILSSEFTIEERKNEILLIYKHLPFCESLKPISKSTFKGKIFAYGREWFEFLLIEYGEWKDEKRR